MTSSSIHLGLAGATALMGLAVATPAIAGTQGNTIEINEIRIEQTGADLDHYVELKGPPGALLDGLAYVVVGDQSSVFPPQQNGYVEEFVALDGFAIGADGFFVIAESSFSLCTPDLVAPLNFEGSDNVTHLLIENCGLGLGSGLDTDADGVAEGLAGCTVVDSVALMQSLNPDGISEDLVYSSTLVGPDGGLVPAQVYRCADTGAWGIGGADLGESDTPCADNLACSGGSGGGSVLINEIRIDDPSTDDNEYFELKGEPGTLLDGLTYIVIGDGSAGSGVLERIIPLDGLAINEDGLFLAVADTFNLVGTPDLIAGGNNLFENSDNVTHLVVRDLAATAATQDDLDTNDDGVLDLIPWTEVVDSISLIESVGSGDLTYSVNSVGPDGNFVPSHSYRCSPDDVWTIGSFFESDGTDTPGAENLSCPGEGGCGGPDPVSCFALNASGGCSDGSCCTLVTDSDPGCATDWDQACVDLAQSLCVSSGPAPQVRLSELRTKQGGNDLDEFVELSGAPGTNLDGVSLVIVGGEGTDTNGVIEGTVNFSGQTIGKSGFHVVAEDSFALGVSDAIQELPFNDFNNKTYLLVFNFTGAVNADLDSGDQCVLDTQPWDALLDEVAVIGPADKAGSIGNCIYSAVTVGPEGNFTPAHIFLCNNATGAWSFGTFNPTDALAADTPGAPNPVDCSTDPVTVCGDGSCDVGEDEVSCPEDCSTGSGCPAFDERNIVAPCTTIFETLDPSCCTIWSDACQSIYDSYCNFQSAPPAPVRISEIRRDQFGADDDEYVEFSGEPGSSIDGHTLLVIGDGSGASGVIEQALPLAGTFDDTGLLVLARPFVPGDVKGEGSGFNPALGTPDIVWPENWSFENSDNLTFILVYGYQGVGGDLGRNEDLDATDDGTLDSSPWLAEVDCLALIETDPAIEGELVYCTEQVGPDGTFAPAHVYFDCALESWQIGLIDPVGAKGTDTPGAANPGCDQVAPPCPGDFDGSGDVNGADLTFLLGVWGTENVEFDLTGDGLISGADLTILLGGWGFCPQ